MFLFFAKNSAQTFLGEWGFKYVHSNEGSRHYTRKDNIDIVKIPRNIIKILSKTTWQISVKLGTMHPSV